MVTATEQSQVIDNMCFMSELKIKGVLVRFTEREKRDLLRLAKADNRKVADWVRVATLKEMAREKAVAKEKEESDFE